MDVRADSRQDWPPVPEHWPLQAAIHSLGMRAWGHSESHKGGGPGVLLTEDPHPRSHIPLSHRIESEERKG